MNLNLKNTFVTISCLFLTITVQAINITGRIFDAKTQEPLMGVTIRVVGSTVGTVSDIEGNYKLEIAKGKITLKASYLSYQTVEITDIEVTKDMTIDIPMHESSQGLGEVTVTGIRKLSTEGSLMGSMRLSNSVVSGISSQQITKNQDRDASEVIKRIPGISIIENKFIIVRGLSQRYNNVWINNSAAPSSESDTRAFSFDIIPSSQIENILIVKSPTPELPADFSGGFIKVETKGIPSENSMQISIGANYNTETDFKDFKYNNTTNYLGFNNGKSDIAGFVSSPLNNNNANAVTEATQKGFNNDWSVKTKTALPDQRISFALNRRYKTENNALWGLVTAVNFSNSSRSFLNMENSRYGIYNTIKDEPAYRYKYTDNQYSMDTRLGGIANIVFSPNSTNKFEFRNMLNRLSQNKYTEREGYQISSGYYGQQKTEYYYSSRLTYSGQFSGKHTFANKDKLDWTLGYAYANKNQPDRRIVNRDENSFEGDPHFGDYLVDQNDISRDFVRVDESLYTFSSNYSHQFKFDHFSPKLNAGIYGEYKDRTYETRSFHYRWDDTALPNDFGYNDVVNEILIPENYGADKLYIFEDTDNRNSYMGTNGLQAGYLALNIPLNKLNIYTGLRVEHSKMSLTNHTSLTDLRTETTDYTYTDLFPSINTSYELDKDQLLRLAYGKTINRQEFREVSPSSYYDFDLFSFIKGNPDLKPAYIHNLDLRYELYPSKSEIISLALFYKHFKNPIESTYLDSGGGDYTYTFENAKSADNYGIELDIKKGLAFIGMSDFSLSFNGALIKSRVRFDQSKGGEQDRPMQGQSPYLVNTGLFYQKKDLNINLLYNIIGKRIVGIGRTDTSSGSTINNDVPNMYEMPRHTFDFAISKRFGIVEINAAVRDILSQKVEFKQFPQYIDENGNTQEREQTTKSFRPGQNISISAKINF